MRGIVGAAAIAVMAMATAATESPAVKQGHAVYDKWCAPCHAPGGDKPGTIALNALYKGAKPAVLDERTDLTPEIVKHFVREGVSVMPFFRKTEVSDADLDALTAYLTRGRR